MTTMKYPSVPGGTTTNMAVSGNGSHHHHVDDVDFFGGSGWPGPNGLMQNDYVDVHSLSLEGSLNLGNDKLLLGSPTGHETDIDSGELDKLLSFNSHNSNLAELKPLPPFTGYTANLSINGIPGHHYHTISQRAPEDNNNNYNSYAEQIVSSSTCNVSADSSGGKWDDVVKLEYAECVNDVTNSVKLYDECNADSSHVKGEMESYEDNMGGLDFAKFIGTSIIADTTVPNNADADEQGGSRESWMDFEALMENAIPDQKNLIISEGMTEFVMSGNANSNYQEYNHPQKMPQSGSTLQSLLTHGSSSMPLLQNRLQNGPPIKQETPSSTNFNNDLISTSSPPANVGSTTDSLLMNANGRFTMQQYNVHGLVDDHHRIRSPDTMLGQNYPHTTTSDITRPTGGPTRNKRSRAQRKQQQAASSTVFPTETNLAMMTGKEKTIHRCTICNRGFLNKSNIKVHMRTHTGEKPFRCETCSKAFRQKAHLLKHQQIHKRIGRD